MAQKLYYEGKLAVLDSVAADFTEHTTYWDGCVMCRIGELAYKHVFARGTLPCDVLFLGEAPGKTEDLLGYPFVGRSGKLLDQWISDIQGKWPLRNAFSWAIANTVLCRPTDCLGGNNRAPTYVEKEACSPRLSFFIHSVAQPKIIVALGRAAMSWIERYGEFKHPWKYIPHPAWILRQGGIGSQQYLAYREKLNAFILRSL